jgi:hypothetical protein
VILNVFERNVINQIVAAEDGKPVNDPVQPYFRAFTGAFSADMPFTFYFENIRKPVMLVYDPTPISARSSHYLFMERCEQIQARIPAIAGFVQELADTGYVRTQPANLEDRPALPPDYVNYWRSYKHFYSGEIDSLFLVCLYELKPTQKLYDVWVKFNPQVLAG